ncbi:MAG: S9 family peptidase, partial [Bacteroidales bacterium]
GKKALLLVSEERLEKRPTTVMTLYLMDLHTLQAEKLVDRDGFMQGASFSPDGKQVLLSGSPEAFGGIGKNVRKGQTPSMTDIQLYLMDLDTRKIKPLTRDFNPCVSSSEWSRADGQIYLTAENRDHIDLFRLDPKNGKIRQIDIPEELVKGFSLADAAPVMAWYGQSASNSDRLYLMNTKKSKSELCEDLSATILKDVRLGECREWNFKNSKGETVYGRFYLPPDFNPSKKYPMIVNYYGGCSPTSRNFESRYPHHAYAALGYVVYVVALPSGATGNGQEWSARHVNTAGDGPAQDIIEGTEKFCKEHPFVNPEKIGCIGASYGGFMSQYIPTLTDRFACAISHAGISDHTSYWGFGYWGYSYSETSMANSYPWSDRDLYVNHSPLYLADKINTPILLIHGDADTNVPFNESIQLFTALKLLGKETALVAVKDQNHHILDYAKRLEWQNTIWAWFAKWLQDDPSWWDTLYPPKSL